MKLYFELGGEMIVIAIRGKEVLFGKMETSGIKYTTIEGIKLSRAGIVKEFPDLEELETGPMRKEAILRFKEKLSKFDNEMDIKKYMITELTKHGYKWKFEERPGHRMRKIKDGEIN